jgi:hypothetical protein
LVATACEAVTEAVVLGRVVPVAEGAPRVAFV